MFSPVAIRTNITNHIAKFSLPKFFSHGAGPIDGIVRRPRPEPLKERQDFLLDTPPISCGSCCDQLVDIIRDVSDRQNSHDCIMQSLHFAVNADALWPRRSTQPRRLGEPLSKIDTPRKAPVRE